jgi:hypothetical protein
MRRSQIAKTKKVRYDDDDIPKRVIVSRKMIVSVGYKLNMTPEQWNMIITKAKSFKPDMTLEMSDSMYGELLFGTKEDIGETLGINCRTQQQLSEWYAKKLGTTRVGYLSQIWFSKTVIIGYVEFNMEKFYVIIANGSKDMCTYSNKRRLDTSSSTVSTTIERMGIELIPHKVEEIIKFEKC